MPANNGTGNGWRRVPLGEVVEINPKEPQPDAEAPFVPMPAVEPGHRWATATQKREGRGGVRFRGGDVLFARITPCLENGKIAQAPLDMPLAGGSTEFIVLRATEQVDRDFLYYLATEASLHERAVGLMVGSTGRQRLSATDLASLEVLIPPLDQQHRITDLMASFDNALRASRELIASAESALAALRNQAFQEAAESTGTVELGTIATLKSGLSWGRDDEVRENDPAAVPTLRVANVQPGWIDMRERTYLRRSDAVERSQVSEGEIVVVRTNGNIDRIGNVHLVPADADGHVLSAFLFAIRANDGADARFIWRMLQSDQVQRAITSATSGSTGLKNIAISWLRSVEIPWPSAEERERILAPIEAMSAALDRAREHQVALQRARSQALSSVLSGGHEIPADYDRLLEAEDLAVPGPIVAA